MATGVAVGIGVLVGALAGFYGGWVDDAADAHHRGLPDRADFILLLVLVAVFGSDLQTSPSPSALVSWTAPRRLVRAEFLSLRDREFVQACRGLGMRDSAHLPARSCPTRCRR